MCQSAPTLARVSSLGMGLPFGCPHLARTSLLGHLTTLACLGHKAVDFAEAGLWTLRATACLVGSPSCSLLCGSTRLLSWEGLLPSTDDPRPQQPPPPLRGRVEEALLGQGGTSLSGTLRTGEVGESTSVSAHLHGGVASPDEQPGTQAGASVHQGLFSSATNRRENTSNPSSPSGLSFLFWRMGSVAPVWHRIPRHTGSFQREK